MIDWKRPLLVAMLLALTLATAGCSQLFQFIDERTDVIGEDPSDTDEVTPAATVTPDSSTRQRSRTSWRDDPDPNDVLENAALRLTEISSAKFELNGSGTVAVDGIGEISLSNVEGAVRPPSTAQASLEVSFAGLQLPVTVVSDDGDVYYRDALSGQWSRAPSRLQFDPGSLFDSQVGVPVLLRSVEDVEVQGSMRIKGRLAWHITGVLPQESMESAAGGLLASDDDVDVDIWIHRFTDDLLAIESTSIAGGDSGEWELRMYDHNLPVEIEDPIARSR